MGTRRTMPKAAARTIEQETERDRLAFHALMRERFDLFTGTGFRSLHRETTYKREDYIQALCFALQGVLENRQDRLLINMPPRVLKSETAAVYLAAYALGLFPNMKIGVVSYTPPLATMVSSPSSYIGIWRADRGAVRLTTTGGGYLSSRRPGLSRGKSLGRDWICRI